MTISPAVAGTSPAISMRSVLLPHPEGPTIETNSPEASANVVGSRARSARPGARYVFSTPSTLTNAAVIPRAGSGSAGARERAWRGRSRGPRGSRTAAAAGCGAPRGPRARRSPPDRPAGRGDPVVVEPRRPRGVRRHHVENLLQLV